MNRQCDNPETEHPGFPCNHADDATCKLSGQHVRATRHSATECTVGYTEIDATATATVPGFVLTEDRAGHVIATAMDAQGNEGRSHDFGAHGVTASTILKFLDASREERAAQAVTLSEYLRVLLDIR